MKIGIDCRTLSLQTTGIKKYLSGLLVALSRQDKDNEYFLFSRQLISLGTGLADNMKQIRISSASNQYFEKVALPLALIRYGADILYCPHNYGLPLFKRNYKIILTVHDIVPRLFRAYWADKPKWERIIYNISSYHSVNIADAIIVDSENTKKDLMKYLRVPGAKLNVIRPSVNVGNEGNSSEAESKAVLSKFNISKKYIMLVGGISYHKNIVTALGAFDILRKDGLFSDYQVVIVGDYKECTEEEKDILRRSSQDIIKTGRVNDDEIGCLYKSASLFIYPSLCEGFGLPVLEAMACGVPVIASNSSSIPEVGGDAILYFEPKDRLDLASKMKRACSDRNLSSGLVSKGLARSRIFSWDKAASEFLNICHSLLNNYSD